jgi:F0F1-type ATP synthase membrane subunit c/vacuolar-type H+-ATPase subunit K
MSPTPPASLTQQFKTINYIGLAMIASVFIYAGIVTGINQGYIPLKLRQTLEAQTAATVKYILLFVAALHYFIIRFFQKISLKAVNRLAPGAIITFALSEAVAIYGLVLFFLNGNSTDFFIFMALSLFYFYLFYPRYQEWEALLIQELSKPKSG